MLNMLLQANSPIFETRIWGILRPVNLYESNRQRLSPLSVGMDLGVLGSKPSNCADCSRRENLKNNQVLVKRKTLQAVLEKCQRALESINTTNCVDEDEEKGIWSDFDYDDQRCGDSSPLREQLEVDEICHLLKSKVESLEFLEKIEGAQTSLPHNIIEDGSSWDVVSEVDLWESSNVDADEEDFVIVKQEDIVEGIVCIMAAYLLSLKETKELTPNQLQEALGKTFSLKKQKGKLQKAWDGSKVIYNVASWGATAIGIYQNPVIIRTATEAFWTSWQVISKLL